MSMIGKSLIHYEISAQIGRGGMGEVYQAKDTKLGRDVAIKILPEEFARDADRVARFQREAKLLASLNHPNIAAIYGLEESDGTNFLVMELIEGDTLAGRIKTGPISVEETLKLALQIAEALEAAHEKGVIHRDLKPANIKITPEGKIKILDFGLAKAFAEDQGEEKPVDSPTLSAEATRKGIILGTAAYMSPEQARGKLVDKRSDIWAFGVILFEMLAGRALFEGEDVTSTLARVLERQPDYSALTPNLHPRIRFLLERCLEKEARNRYSSISDVRVEIQKVLADPSGIFVLDATLAKPRRKMLLSLPWVATIAILCIIAAGIIGWNLRTREPDQVIRFDYELPDDQQMINQIGNFGISPDGRQFAYTATGGIYLRSIDELNAKLIPGSDGTTNTPTFSPDGKSIAYVSVDDRKLKKIAIAGGTPIVLCDLESSFWGMSWEQEDFIVYSEVGIGIMKVSSKGGTPEIIVASKTERLADPQILPDRESVMYTIETEQPRIMVKPLKKEEPKELFAGKFWEYLPSGHIIYWDYENNLCAVQFDSDKLETVGEYVSMIPNVKDFAISKSGTLIYTLVVPEEEGPKRTLVWVDKKGNEEPIAAPPKLYSLARFSPDGERIALEVGSYPSEDIYIWELERKNLTKLAIDETREKQPVWTPDSNKIIYYSDHEKTAGGIYCRAFDGSGEVKQIYLSSDSTPLPASFPWSISKDGKFLLIQDLISMINSDISILTMEGDQERKFLLQQEFSEAQPTVSPDGHWMAYCSSEETNDFLLSDVYIRPFPDVEKIKRKVSTDGGTSPVWSPDGKELYYLSRDNSVMVVDVKTEPTFWLGTPRKLFQSEYLPFSESAGSPYDIHPDGDRFVMIKLPLGVSDTKVTGPRKINIILNWDEELKQRVLVD